MVHTADKKRNAPLRFPLKRSLRFAPRSLDRRIWEMKAKLMKVLHVFGIDVLLLGLFEKIALGLIKRLPDFQNRVLEVIEECRQITTVD